MPAALNGFTLWNIAVAVLMLIAYGWPIAQFFGPGAPDWPGVRRALARISTRLMNPPWTHSDVLPPATPSSRARPADLRAAIEDLT